MSLDEKYMESGEWDPKRNPLAFQVGQVKTQEADQLARAVALIEDELTKLRGHAPDPAESLIHFNEETDAKLRSLGTDL